VHHLRSVAGGALLLESRDLRSAQAGRERGDRHRRAGRALVVAGQLPQPRPLPPQEREAFSSADVKYTFDVVREAKDAPAKLRLSPRKDWYANVEAIEAPDAHTVIFRLKRPQPSLILMLASGYSPVYPAHVPLAELRQRCVGTGP